jgi:hypothetical protein
MAMCNAPCIAGRWVCVFNHNVVWLQCREQRAVGWYQCVCGIHRVIVIAVIGHQLGINSPRSYPVGVWTNNTVLVVEFDRRTMMWIDQRNRVDVCWCAKLKHHVATSQRRTWILAVTVLRENQALIHRNTVLTSASLATIVTRAFCIWIHNTTGVGRSQLKRTTRGRLRIKHHHRVFTFFSP